MDSQIHDSGRIDYKRTGVYRVRRDRSLVWATKNGTQVWARPGECVRVNAPITAYLQATKQFDRLEKVDEKDLPHGTPILTEATARPELQRRMAELAGPTAFPLEGEGRRKRVSAPAKAPKAPEAKPEPTEAEREAAEDAADVAAADEAYAEWEAGGKKTLSAEEARAELELGDDAPAKAPKKPARKKAGTKRTGGEA